MLIYLRRKHEVVGIMGCVYNLISNLLHKRECPLMLSGDKMSNEDILLASTEILKYINNFDYGRILKILNDNAHLKNIYLSASNNYEKLHLYRIYCEGKDIGTDNKIILKFINESFHTENDYIYQLNPRDFALVPQFVIDECDKVFAQI